jgi:hypothetical protein
VDLEKNPPKPAKIRPNPCQKKLQFNDLQVG